MNDLHDFIEQSRKSITIDIVKNLHNQSAGAIAARMIKEHAGLDELAGFIKSEKDKIDIFTAFKIPEQNKTSLIRKLEALKKEKEIVFSSYDEILITGKSKRKTAVRVILLFKQSSPEKIPDLWKTATNFLFYYDANGNRKKFSRKKLSATYTGSTDYAY